MVVWRQLAAIVAEHGAAALVTVLVRKARRRARPAPLVVRPDGAFHGTIGGGRLEWEALREARAALAAGRGAARFGEHVLGPDLGQCCGGRVTLSIEIFDGSDADRTAVLASAEPEGCRTELFLFGSWVAMVARPVWKVSCRSVSSVFHNCKICLNVLSSSPL